MAPSTEQLTLFIFPVPEPDSSVLELLDRFEVEIMADERVLLIEAIATGHRHNGAECTCALSNGPLIGFESRPIPPTSWVARALAGQLPIQVRIPVIDSPFD